MKTMYVYILKCSDNTYYTGVTNNLERRYREHCMGINPDCYTHSRRPLELVFHEIYNDPTIAIAWEKRIKKWSKAKKEALISEHYEKLPELSKKKFKSENEE